MHRITFDYDLCGIPLQVEAKFTGEYVPASHTDPADYPVLDDITAECHGQQVDIDDLYFEVVSADKEVKRANQRIDSRGRVIERKRLSEALENKATELLADNGWEGE
jgi:hypothetical protein